MPHANVINNIYCIYDRYESTQTKRMLKLNVLAFLCSRNAEDCFFRVTTSGPQNHTAVDEVTNFCGSVCTALIMIADWDSFNGLCYHSFVICFENISARLGL